MVDKNIPINKGNYTMETPDREKIFERYRGEGWEKEYRTYRTNWVKYAREQYLSEYPLLVDVELSSVCNLNCPMCYTITEQFKKSVNAGFMDYNLFTRIIHEIGGKVPALRLSLRGEPTLHERFIDCIKFAKSEGIKEVSFLTNGSKLSPEYFKKIMLAGADWVTISIDGLGEVYESIRRPLKFEDTLMKTKAAKAIKEKHASHRPVIKIQTVWPAVRDDPATYYDTFSPYVDLIAFNPLIDYLSKDKVIHYEDNFSCPQLYQRLVVGSDGRVMMCANDEVNSVIVGDAKTETIYDIWHGDKLQAIRNLHKKIDGFKQMDVCKKCYLPRKTEEGERGTINGRNFIVKNYLNRRQIVGT